MLSIPVLCARIFKAAIAAQIGSTQDLIAYRKTGATILASGTAIEVLL